MFKSFKELKASGKRLLGMFVQSRSEEIVEIIGYSGFDLVIIDMEHGPFDIEVALNLVRAADAAGITPIVRVPENSNTAILKALDIGASAVIIPGISSKEDAEKAVKASKYGPIGIRGACPSVRANKYGAGDPNYLRTANDKTSVILLVEGKEGVKNFDEIISVPYIDAVMLGPFDLSVSLGLPGEVHNPLVRKALKEMANKAKEKGVYVGTFSVDLDDVKEWFSLGLNYVAYNVDTLLFYETCKRARDYIGE
ncbi:MAG: 4-hydroxy-2-oxoheptanedioate aldolase [bacterium]|nr:4-hydroxy-2-oxoheptanedioate aldolase [bacterium]